MSECKHTGFYSNVHCSGCGEYAPTIIAKLQAENDKLQAVVDAGNAVMRNYKYKNAGWGVSGVYAELEQSIKEVER